VVREELGEVAPRTRVRPTAAIRFQKAAGGLFDAPLARQGQAEVLVGVVPFGIKRDGRPGVDLGVRVPA
jgi:hypothetical protein